MKLSLLPLSTDVRTMVYDRLDNVYGLTSAYNSAIADISGNSVDGTTLKTEFGDIYFGIGGAVFYMADGHTCYGIDDLRHTKSKLQDLEYLLESHGAERVCIQVEL